MKGFLVFVTLALVAATASAKVPRVNYDIELVQRGIIEDAINLVRCVKGAIESAKNRINNVIASLQGFKVLLDKYVDSFNKCLESGGGIIGGLESAQCVIDLAKGLKGDVNDTVATLVNSVQDLLAVVGELTACLN